MKSNAWLKIGALLALPVLMLAGGCSAGGARGSILTEKAEAQPIQTQLNVSGVLAPSQTVNVASRFSGQILAVHGDVGTVVKAGDVLVEMDTETLKAQMAQAQASIQSAKADLQVSKSKSEITRVTLDGAQKNYDRTKALYQASAASQSQMDAASDTLDSARKQYLNDSGPAVEKAKATIATAEASLKNYQVQVANGTLRAPIDGVITNRSANPGEVASLGGTVLSLADTSHLKLKGTISQEMLPFVKAGMPVDVQVDIYPEKKYKGTITSVGPVAVSTGAVFPIEITVENDGSVLAGLSARVSLAVSGVHRVVVPASALVENEGKAWVYCARNGKIEKQIVRVGVHSSKGIEILSGIQAGESIVVAGIDQVREGMTAPGQ